MSFFRQFTLLNKHQNLTDHETENLVFDRNYGPKVDKRGRINGVLLCI